MEKKGAQICGRLVLVPYPHQGHMTPMLQLGALLHSKGFSITIAHPNFNSPNPSNYPDFNYQPLPDQLSEMGIPSWNTLALISALNTNCPLPLEEYLQAQASAQRCPHERIVCVFYDALMYFADGVAGGAKLPSISLRICNASDMFAHVAFPRLVAEGYFPLKDSILEEPVHDLHPLRFKDLPLTHCETFALKLNKALADIGNAAAVVVNTVEFLEHSSLSKLHQHYKVPVLSIGPLHKIAPPLATSFLEEDTSCIAWLDKQAPKSVLYVSFGSLATMDEHELAEMAWGLANSGQPFLWVVRSGSVSGSEWDEFLPEGFKEAVGGRGCIVKWAPQKEVLEHFAVGGFCSHCGWNSTLESISEGVPMICRPCFGDQNVNARYVSHVWKVGLTLENWPERGEIERAIRRLMVEKEGEEIRQNAIDKKEKIRLAMDKGGSSYNALNQLVELILSFW